MKISYFIFLLIINIIMLCVFRIDYIGFVVPVTIGLFLLLNLLNMSLKNGGTIFHPLPMSCIILILSFVLSPAISAGMQVYLLNPPRNIDWNRWLIILNWMYLVGIILFYFACKIFFKNNNKKYDLTIIVDKTKLLIVSSIFLLISFFCQFLVYLKFGGILSYMTKWTEDRGEFDGLGIWYMLAEPFPIIFLIFIILYLGKDRIKNSFTLITSIFVVFFILKMLFGGFRGSRSNTIWGLYWFAGIIHLYVHKLKKVHYIIGVVFLTLFMSTYALYKSYGVEAFSGEYSLSDTKRYNNNPVIEMYLGDFSRATINAYQLAQIHDLNIYENKYGQTYLSSISKIIIPIKYLYVGHNKNSAGAEIVGGIKVNPTVDDYHNSRVYGVYGEAILNFGIFFSIISLFFVGLIIVKLDNYCRNYGAKSIYIFLIPFISNLSLTMLLSDSDNVVFFVLKNGLLVVGYLYVLSVTSIKEYRYASN